MCLKALQTESIIYCMNTDISNVYNAVFKKTYCSSPRYLTPGIFKDPHFSRFFYKENLERLYYNGSEGSRTFSVYIFFDKETHLIERMECSSEILECDFDDFSVYKKVYNGFLNDFCDAFDRYVTVPETKKSKQKKRWLRRD